MMVADIFTALAEDRPYRKGMSKEGIIQIIKQFSDNRLLDTRIVNLLFENYNEIFSYVAEKTGCCQGVLRKTIFFYTLTIHILDYQ